MFLIILGNDLYPAGLSLHLLMVGVSDVLISPMKLRQIGTVGRATVPAGIGRHGGRPYAKTAQFLFWIRLAVFLARGRARMKDQF